MIKNVYLILVNGSDDRAAMGVTDDESLPLKLLQRLAHGTSAHTHLLGDVFLSQAVTDWQLTKEDGVANRLQHRVAKRLIPYLAKM